MIKSSLVQRWVWFVGLWLASVACLAVIAFIIRSVVL